MILFKPYPTFTINVTYTNIFTSIVQTHTLLTGRSEEGNKMIAEKDEVIGKAVDSAWQIMEDEVIREQCRAREEWIINDRYTKKLIAEQEEKLAEQDKKLAAQDEKLAAQDEKLTKQNEKLAEQAAEINRLKALLEEAGSENRPPETTDDIE